MTIETAVLVLKTLRGRCQMRHDKFFNLAVAGESSYLPMAEDEADYIAAIDVGLDALVQPSSAPEVETAKVNLRKEHS